MEGLSGAIREALLALPEDRGRRARPTSNGRSRRRRTTSGWTPRCRLPKRRPCRRASAIDKKINQELVPKILALNDPFQEVRSHIGALTYQIEVSHSESSKDSLRKEIEELRAEKHDVSLPGEDQKRSMDFKAMSDQLQAWKDEKAKLLQQRVELMKAGHGTARQARQVPVRPHRGGQHGDHRRGAELAGQVRYPHTPDSRQGCRPGGPLRDLPPGHARAGVHHQGGDGRRGRCSPATRIRSC